jgi:hypothetical protein
MKLQENLKAFVDGEMSAQECALIHKELESSLELQKEVNDLNRLSASIRAYVTQPKPVGLEATLASLEKAKPKARAKTLMVHQLRWVSGFAVAIIFIGLAGKMLTSSSGDHDDSDINPALAKAAPSPDTASSTVASSSKSKRNDPILQNGAVHDALSGDGAPSAMAGAMAKKANVRDLSSQFNAGASRARTTLPATPGLPIPSDADKIAASKATRTIEGIPKRGLIVKDASLGVKVKNVAESQHTAEGIAVGLGGYVERSDRSEAEGSKGEASLILRVPIQHFEDAVKQIRSLGDVVSDSSSGNDVTSDVVDMDARLKVLRAEESDYLVLLARARSTSAIMAIKDKLTEIRQQIEGIDSERKSTKDLASYSTITVELTQTGRDVKPILLETDKSWLTGTWTSAVDGLGAAGKVIAQLFIFVLVWSPIWIPVALLSAWLYRRYKW